MIAWGIEADSRNTSPASRLRPMHSIGSQTIPLEKLLLEYLGSWLD